MKRFFSLNSYLPRLGGWYILVVIFISQLLAIPGAVLGTTSINLNAEFDQKTMAEISRYTPVLILVGNIILLAIVWYLTPNARKRLTAWSTKQIRSNEKEELAAWKEITSITWRYSILAFFTAVFVQILPPSLYFYQKSLTTFDQLVYSLMGGLVSLLTIIIIAVLLI